MKAFLNLQGGLTRGAVPDNERYEKHAENLRNTRRWMNVQEEKLKGKDREILRLKNELLQLRSGLYVAKEQVFLSSGAISDAVPNDERYGEQAETLKNTQRWLIRQKKTLEAKDQEIFQLKNELRAVKGPVEDGEGTKKGRYLPVFRFSRAFGVGRGVKAFLSLWGGLTRGAVSDNERYGEQTENLRNTRRRIEEQKKALKSKDREVFRLKSQLHAAREQADLGSSVKRKVVPDVEEHGEQAEELRSAYRQVSEQKKALRSKNREIFQLRNELVVAKERVKGALKGRSASQVTVEPEVGALPDFLIIGAQKGGTTTLYDLLTQHPNVERAALKELNYFDNNFEKGVEWYRSQFPPPRWKDGRRSITGEATPDYLFHPLAPERVAEVVPQARLIVLLRNPVDRVYSSYHHEVGSVRELRRFEEAVEAEREWLPIEEDGEREQRRPFPYLKMGIYVDQLRRWSEFFDEEQMLVLKSEDFFERELETLKVVLDFLGLPDWEPEALRILNQGHYEREMDPSTRRRLEEYFEPHNRRLYEHLGVNFGW